MKDFLTDDEINALESQGGVKEFISDEEMSQIEASQQPSGKPGYLERVGTAIEEAGKKNIERQRVGDLPFTSSLRGATESMGAIIGEAPGVKQLGELAGKGLGKLAQAMPGTAGALGKLGQKYTETVPQPLQDVAAAGMNIAGLVPTLGGAKLGQLGAKAGMKAVGPKMESAANRIQGTKVKINIPEQKQGAKNEMYGKYGVFGNAQDVQQQWQKKIEDTYNQVKSKISDVELADPENYTYVNDIFDNALTTVEKYGKSPTEKLEVQRAIESLRQKYVDAYQDGKINILDAQAEKQVAGKKGDWLERSGAMSGNPDASTQAKAYNAVYDAFKTTIEKKGSPGIKELNKQLSEMIPMERAASKQVLVQNRKNPISLDDYIGGLAVASSAAHGNILPGMVMLGNIVSKSPLTAKGLYGLGRKFQGKNRP